MDEITGSAPDFTIPGANMQSLQNMVDWCLAEGLIAVIDPVHNWANNNDPNLEYDPADITKLQKIWEQVAAHFADYDLENVVFEIMNEPHGDDDVAEIIQVGLAAIRGVPGNEQRIVIVSGDGFSTQALIDAFDNDEIPANDNYLIGTYHYYDPRDFTRQGSTGGNISWGTTAEFNAVSAAFDEVVTANNNWASRNDTEPLPVYLGEFGVDNEADNWNEDRERWLSWVRMQAEARGFSWAHWNMYNNSDGSKGMGPWTLAERNDPSLRTFDVAPLEALTGFYEFEDGSVFSEMGAFTRDEATGTYRVRIHYASAVDRTVRLVTAAQVLNNVLFPATGSADSWSTLEVDILFNGSTSAGIDNESLKIVATPDSGPALDWVHISAP